MTTSPTPRPTTPRETPSAGITGFVDRGDQGYKHSLSNLQIQMIAIGGAVGVGLFLGVGSRIQAAGPALVLSYFVVGAVVYLLMRALGELVLYRPTTGAFVSYAREFVGPRFAHLTGWIYVTLAALAGIVEMAAIGVYVQYWFADVPGWIPSLLALLIIAGTNLLSVQAYGNIEFGAAAIKVLAIVLFVVAGVLVVGLSMAGVLHTEATLANLWTGGFAPNGVLPVILVMQGVIFSFSAVEIVGISAGEAKDPRHTMPKAIKAVIVRIGLFYIASILVLCMLLPSQSYSGDESPFVTALSSLGVTGLGGVMNFVVLTAAISGVNATLYATVRLLRNLAANGSAPKITNRMSRRGIPTGALMSVGSVYLVGVLLIYVAGAADVFEIALGACAAFIVFGWIAIFVSHLGFRRRVAAGTIDQPNFRMPGSPYTDWICLAFLALAFVALTFDLSNPHWYYTLIASVILIGIHLLTYEYYRRRTPSRPDADPE
jgi:L-asparagine permease